MPHHTSWFHYLLDWLIGHTVLERNMHNFGKTMMGQPVGWHAAEPLAMSLFIVILISILVWRARPQIENHKKSVIPDDKLTLRTFLEVFVGYFYDMMKGMMGGTRAKRYFPIIGTCAMFIFFSNMLGLLPGVNPPTSTWSITAGCALVVFLAFNYYGLKENGFGYIKHLAGPVWWLAPLIFPLEVFSTILRPITLSVRLMINMAVDHLLLAVFMGLGIPLLIPIPIMMLGTLVALIQTLVFCLLSSIYITLATDHEDHGPATGEPGDAHAKDAHAH